MEGVNSRWNSANVLGRSYNDWNIFNNRKREKFGKCVIGTRTCTDATLVLGKVDKHSPFHHHVNAIEEYSLQGRRLNQIRYVDIFETVLYRLVASVNSDSCDRFKAFPPFPVTFLISPWNNTGHGRIHKVSFGRCDAKQI